MATNSFISKTPYLSLQFGGIAESVRRRSKKSQMQGGARLQARHTVLVC